MSSAPAVSVRVGGQALTDGVLMRSPLAWAVARTDGSVEVGSVTPTRWSRVPVVRVLTSLLPALGLGLKAMACGRSGNRSRRTGLFVVVALVGTMFLTPLLPSTPSPVQSAGLALATIAAMRLLAPRSLWRFHGAEHKAVTAYEAGVDVGDTEGALRASRVHPRCGTNLVALLLVPLALLSHLPGLLQVVAALVLLGIAAELLTVSARFPSSPATKVLLAPGLVLQRYATTSEPTFDEQAVACRALAACLAEHARLDSPAELFAESAL
jgi:uncharacterized protein YqhQ